MPEPHRSSSARVLAFLLACHLAGAAGLAVPAMARSLTSEQADERLHYRWHLTGVLGRVAGLVLPSKGDGELRAGPGADGSTVTELEITSPQSAADEYFLYGAELTRDGTTREAWSSYRWRKEAKSKRSEVEEEGVVDVASGIQLIRRRQPRYLTMRIWSDGKIYPVVVERREPEQIQVPAGRYQAVHYSVRGLNLPDERHWKGGLDLWLAPDAHATPVRIEVHRGFASVRLDLVGMERDS
jgi:hypothetical protein